MYTSHNSHRAAHPVNARLIDLLDQVRQEFDTQNGRAGDYEQQLSSQVHEMDNIRRKLYDLEQAQITIKAKYEEELNRLRHELEARGGPHHASLGGPSHAPAPAPQVGHGHQNLFGNIMAGGGSQGGPGLAPPPPEPAQPQGIPAHMGQGPPVQAPGPPQPVPFGSYPQPPSANGYQPQPPQPTQSPGPAGRGRGAPRGPPGPATPQQNSAAPYPGSPHVPRPTPPPGQGAGPLGIATHGPRNVGNSLAELDVEQMPAHLKREGQDWYVVFNPAIRRVLDVDLVHTLPHASVVCCVRFSLDGRYVATGCNRLAQIYDVVSGELVASLQDMQTNEDGDLYIRSVCFSPDGKYLATGAEDKIIRVWEISTAKIVHSFTGHEQDIYSLDFARNGRLIASGSGDRTVRLWDLDSNRQVLQLLIDDGVTTVAISPDNRYVAAGSLDKSVRVWDVSGHIAERLEGEYGHRDSVYSVAFAPSGTELVSGSLDKTIKMWELGGQSVRPGPRTGRCIRTFEGHRDFVLSVALTPDGAWVLSGSKDRGVQFWDPHTGTAQLMLQGHKNSVISVAPSPTGELFATGSGDLRARIWRYKPYHGP